MALKEAAGLSESGGVCDLELGGCFFLETGPGLYPSHFRPVEEHFWQTGLASSHLTRLTLTRH